MQLQKFDLSTTGVSDLEFEAYFELTVQSDTLCHVSTQKNCVAHKLK